MSVNIKNFFKDKNQEESIDFDGIFKNLISHKKIGIIIFLISFLTIFIPLTLIKSKEKLYLGEFKLLIKDPISSQSSSSQFSDSVSLAGLGSLTQVDNLPTLISFLKSDAILGKLALKYGYTTKQFSNLLKIEQGGFNNKAEGILNVYLTIDEPLKGREIINELSKTFLNASSKYNQDRLNSGLTFIQKVRPNYEKKIALLEEELYHFEKKYRIIRNNEQVVINIIRKDSFLKDKIKNLENNSSSSNQKELEILKKRLSEIQNEFKDPYLIVKNLNSIKGEIEDYSNAIKRFRALSETYLLEIAQNAIPWRIISPPFMNKSPIKVEYFKLFTFSALGSSLITFLILFIYLTNKNQFRDEEDIKNYINLQCLGSLPKLKTNELSEIKNINDLKNSLEDKNSNLLIFQKSIEDYCIRIKNLNEKNNFKSFFLASPISEEIKILVNIISSIILSNTNERVVLVDTNFVSPSLEKFFNLNSSIGLLDYLANKKIQTSEIINKSTINNYLDIISAGKDLSNNNMLLGSSRMRELIEHLKINYQYILINGSSIKNSPQSAINGSLSDLTTVIISIKNIKKLDLVESFERLIQSGSNIDSFLIINQDLK